MVGFFYNGMKGEPYGRLFTVTQEYLALADPNRTTPLVQGNAVLDMIAADLRSQYRIGYYPDRPAKDRKWHSAQIRMKNPDYYARARKEYLDK